MKKLKLILSCMALSIGVFAFSGVVAYAEDAPAAGEGEAAVAVLEAAPEPQPATEPAPVVQELAATAAEMPAPEAVEPALESLASTALPALEAPAAVDAPMAATPEAASLVGDVDVLAAEGDGERFEDGKWYFYEDGQRISGWKNLSDGRLVYYNADGSMHWGESLMEDGKWYYFRPGDGAWSGGHQNFDGRDLYYDWENGMYLDKEWQDAEGRWWFASGDNGAPLLGEVWLDDGRIVFYDENQGMLFGEHNIGGYWYYFQTADGAANITTGAGPLRAGDLAFDWWELADGRVVYYNPEMLFGEVQFSDGSWWYFDPANGNCAEGFTVLPDGREVFYDWQDGMLFGWWIIDNEYLCYFNESNGHLEHREPYTG